jgi:ABC-2 type transport system permease protein
MRGFFGLAPFLFVFFSPAITLRLLAEERRTGTLEILITMPVRDVEVILGKYLAALSLLVVALLLTLPYAFTISAFGPLDWGPVWGGYVGLVLMGAAFLAVGVAASSFTENQIIAFVIALFVSMAFLMVDRFLAFLPSTVAAIAEYLSFDYHFRDASRGVIDTRDIIFYVSFAVLCLFLAFRSLESRRWR